jgi:tight adherence protein B
VRAVSAEGRLSGMFLTAMPFVLFFVVSLMNPEYFFNDVVRNHPITGPALVLGLTMLVVGNIMIYRMVNFKV